MKRLTLFVLLCLAAQACGNSKTSPPQGLDRKDAPTMTSSTPTSPAAATGSLPVEPGSQAELLSATHLFSVELVTVTPSPWAPGDDGLEHRSVKMDLRLSAAAKGSFTVAAGQPFSATIDQARENALVVNDYHGLWTHVSPQPAAGVKYFVVAVAAGAGPQDPASLLKEPVVKQLLDPAAAADVPIAEQGEAVFNAALAQGGEHAREEASRALLRFADSHAAAAGALFGRYVEDRISHSIEGDREVRNELSSLLSRPDASPGLRLEVIGIVEETLAEESVDHDFVVSAARALAGLLLEPRAAAAHERIASVSLFQAVFPDETTARLKPADVAADPAQRARIAAVLRSVNHPHAAKLAQWISH